MKSKKITNKRTYRSNKIKNESVESIKKAKIKSVKKSALNKSIRRTIYYYKKRTAPYLEGLEGSGAISKYEMKNIKTTINSYFEVANLVLSKNKEDENYQQELKQTLKEVLKFLKRLEQCGYSTGLYLRNYGFHPIFLPESLWNSLSSIKLAKALELAEQYVEKEIERTIKKKISKKSRRKVL